MNLPNQNTPPVDHELDNLWGLFIVLCVLVGVWKIILVLWNYTVKYFQVDVIAVSVIYFKVVEQENYKHKEFGQWLGLW